MIICKTKVIYPNVVDVLAEVILNEIPMDDIKSKWSIVSIEKLRV